MEKRLLMIEKKQSGIKAGFPVFTIVIVLLGLTFFFIYESKASADETLDQSLSDMQVKISSNGYTAIFRLFDTVAAKEFYNQLPLKLDLSNFRNAQWMFYPPEELNVSPHEAYHDGKKGDLSYYAPWGDVFMLYKDFYARDEMHRLGRGFSGIDTISLMSGSAVIERAEPQTGAEAMYIQVSANGNTALFKLNDSQAAKELYVQLPLTVEVEDFGGKEKIFYPPKKLDASGTPEADANAGSLAYYAPWGDVVMFYKKFGTARGLFELGEAVSGSEYIKDMSGKIVLTKASE